MELHFVALNNLVILAIRPALDPILTPLPALESSLKFPVKLTVVSEEPSSSLETVANTQVMSMTRDIVETRSSQKFKLKKYH
jgi:hypothetical protein